MAFQLSTDSNSDSEHSFVQSSATMSVSEEARPIIGFNLQIDDGDNPIARVHTLYMRAIQNAGGVALLIPPMDDAGLEHILPMLHGLVLIGGPDYSPALYGEKPHPTVSLISPIRQEFDLRLTSAALERARQGRLAVLGICGGLQVINIACGGSLLQDVPTAFPMSSLHHGTTDGWRKGWNLHGVRLEEGCRLREIYGTADIQVPSAHHQAVNRVGKGLRIVGHATDGVPEAIEWESRDAFVLGVQYHPERDYDNHVKLFEALVTAARTVARV